MVWILVGSLGCLDPGRSTIDAATKKLYIIIYIYILYSIYHDISTIDIYISYIYAVIKLGQQSDLKHLPAFDPWDVGPNAAVLVHSAPHLARGITAALDHIAAGGDVVPDIAARTKRIILA